MSGEGVIFFGPPGSGKGTQAELVARQLGFDHVSTGEVLRSEVAEGTELGLLVKDTLASGKLVSDDIVTQIVARRVATARLFLLDGFPRTRRQAQALDDLLVDANKSIAHFIFFVADEAALIERIQNRSRLEGRSDDTISVFKERFRSFAKEADAIIDFYEGKGIVGRVDATATREDVTKAVLHILGNPK